MILRKWNEHYFIKQVSETIQCMHGITWHLLRILIRSRWCKTFWSLDAISLENTRLFRQITSLPQFTSREWLSYCSKRVEYFSLLLIMKHRWSLWKVRLSAAVRFLCLVVWYSTRGQAFHLAIRRCSTPKNAPFRRNSFMNFT